MNSISVRKIGKCYKVYPSRGERLKEWLLPFSEKRHEEKWVLRDVTLDIVKGEAVGIVGMNGAGKSTLLKIITGTTTPTTGTVAVRGSVSAILELGLGFHPSFTGRQNVYMSGQLMGYSAGEISARMKEIEDFAEIGKAIDAPVRTYSSGMRVRLAFSVATMRRPDILIVDEALSVGDAYFQHKSFGRIKDFCRAGTTLLLVSHSPGSVQAVCDRAILLDRGEIRMTGRPQGVLDYYNAMLGGKSDTEKIEQKEVHGLVQTVSGNGRAKITRVTVCGEAGEEAELLTVGEDAKIVVEALLMDDVERMTCGILIKNHLGESIFGTNSECSHQSPSSLKKGERVRFTFSLQMNVGEGNYSVTAALHDAREHIAESYEWRDLAAVFEVVNTRLDHFDGLAYLATSLSIEREGER